MCEVEKNKPVRHWSNEKQEALISFYCALHTDMTAQIKGKRRSLSNKEILYLILCDMKKTKSEMSDILGIDKESLRTYKFRIKQKGK